MSFRQDVMALNSNKILIVFVLFLSVGAFYIAWASLPNTSLNSLKTNGSDFSTLRRLMLLEQEMADLRERYEQMTLDLDQQTRLQRSLMQYVQQQVGVDSRYSSIQESKINSADLR
mgnify:CR=1 FL=1